MDSDYRLRIAEAVGKLDAWLDTIRSDHGYSGPVAHWWQDCLYFTGTGLDWRYEGIIAGYLNLYHKTGENCWLEKACRAGNDLVEGQLESGLFRNSNFEINPYPGGTPHEASCDLALIRLAKTLRSAGYYDWNRYASAAEKNLKNIIIGILWDPQQQFFSNDFDDPSFTPNKAATIVEALFAWVSFSLEEEYLETYAIPTLQAILDSQVNAPGLHGAISQSVSNGKPDGRYFPFYIARCIPALVQGYEQIGWLRYLEAAKAAMRFLDHTRMADGSLPQVLYASGHSNRYPQWIAGAGDFLRAMHILQPYEIEMDPGPTLAWLLAGQLPSGGISTAQGFGLQGIFSSRSTLSDFRDLLPVCGWVDKVFRALCVYLPLGCHIETAATEETELECLYKGRLARYHETEKFIEVLQGSKIVYHWQKGALWAEACAV